MPGSPPGELRVKAGGVADQPDSGTHGEAFGEAQERPQHGASPSVGAAGVPQAQQGVLAGPVGPDEADGLPRPTASGDCAVWECRRGALHGAQIDDGAGIGGVYDPPLVGARRGSPARQSRVGLSFFPGRGVLLRAALRPRYSNAARGPARAPPVAAGSPTCRCHHPQRRSTTARRCVGPVLLEGPVEARKKRRRPCRPPTGERRHRQALFSEVRSHGRRSLRLVSALWPQRHRAAGVRLPAPPPEPPLWRRSRPAAYRRPIPHTEGVVHESQSRPVTSWAWPPC